MHPDFSEKALNRLLEACLFSAHVCAPRAQLEHERKLELDIGERHRHVIGSQLISKLKDAPLAFWGIYGAGQARGVGGRPLYATQVFSASDKFVRPLCDIMSAKNPDDVS